MYGLSSEVLNDITAVFKSFPEIESAIVYGSRAMGNYRPGSDIDITFAGEKMNLSILFAVEDKLDELYLPYKFDLSLLPHIDNMDLLEHIHRAGKILYSRDKAV